MHLSDRGGCDRRPEFGEQRGDRRFQRVFNRLSRFVLREGRESVLQGGEIGRKLAADDVVAGGEELAEFDVGRPERSERSGQPRLVGHVVARPICLLFTQRGGPGGGQGGRRAATELGRGPRGRLTGGCTPPPGSAAPCWQLRSLLQGRRVEWIAAIPPVRLR